MSKQTNEYYTLDELSNKNKALKKWYDEIANYLKQSKKEFEHYHQEVLCEVPWGVPIEITKSRPVYYIDAGGEDKFLVMNPDDKYDKPLCNMLNVFGSRESAIQHKKMLRDWRKDGLIANAKGEQISIQVLLPLLKKGKVLFSPHDKKWKWVDYSF